MKKYLFWIIALMFVLKGFDVYAARPFDAYSLRPMGMGNAFTAVADDYNAIYFNPAGIAHLDRFDIDVPLNLMISKDTASLLNEMSKISNNLETSEGKNKITPQFKEALDKLLELTDHTLGGRTELSVGWVLPNLKLGGAYLGLGLGAYAQLGTKVYIQPVGLPIQKPFNLLNDELIVQTGGDYVVSGSLAMMAPFKEFSGNSTLGVTIKALNRIYLDNEEKPIVFSSLLKEDIDIEKHFNLNEAKTKSGVGFDLGWMYEYNKMIRLGLMVKDISNSLKVDPNIRIGMAIKPMKSFALGKKIPPVDATFAFDLDNLNNKVRKERKLLDKLHLGTELKLAPFKNRSLVLSLRAGNNQGYLTLGTGIKILWLLNADYAYFGDPVADWHSLSLRF
ncbi:MAG: conjugal transfer protein TraF, partial [Bdellovibrio sp.]|nr:conjugal transfer protein TraF [Bdellovibrio sp.]